MMMDGTSLNVKKWNIIYPVYINSKKMVAEGRRIGVEKACENPTCIEINNCCNYLKIPCTIEAYPRDFMQRRRVRVLLKREDVSPYNSVIALSSGSCIRKHFCADARCVGEFGSCLFCSRSFCLGCENGPELLAEVLL